MPSTVLVTGGMDVHNIERHHDQKLMYADEQLLAYLVATYTLRLSAMTGAL
jgi:hypothetical protein